MPRKLTKAEKALNASRKRYGYKGLPGLGIGAVSPLPVGADETAPVFGELFSMFRNLGREVFSDLDADASDAKVMEAISRNIETPATVGSSGYRAAFGTVDEQIAGYKRFESAYRKAIQIELNEGVGNSEARKILLRKALDPSSQINLNLLSSRQAQRELRENFGSNVFQTERVIKNIGLPGIFTPSTNPARVTSRYAVSSAGGYEPAIDMLQSATFSIDPSAVRGAYTPPSASLRMGMSSLPSSRTLEQRMARGGRLSFEHLPDGAILHSLDIEAEDVTPDALMRSLSIGSDKLSKDASGNISISPLPGIENQEFGSALITPKLKGLPSTDPTDLSRTIDFATATARRETEFGVASAKVNIFDASKIFDLTTGEGRESAAKHYIKMLEEVNKTGHYVVATNAEAYDIPKLAQTLRSIKEFESMGGLPVLEQFEEKMANGGLIDTLGLARDVLNNKLAQRLSTATSSTEEKALLAFKTLLSEDVRHTTTVAGQSVSGFGLGNMLQSTNLLQLMAESGDTNQIDLINTLATSNAAHTGPVDRRVSLYLASHMNNLDFADPDTGLDLSLLPKDVRENILKAQRNIAASRATVLTTNISDPRELVRSAYDHITKSDAIQKVELGISPQGTENAVSELAGLKGTIKFDPNSRTFKLFTGPDAVAQSLPAGFDAEAHIRTTLQQMRSVPAGSDLPNNQTQILSLGVSPMQIGEIDSINKLITGSRTTPLIDAVTPRITDASEADFIGGLTATRSTIKLPFMEDTGTIPTSVTSLMRGRFEAIMPAMADVYRDTLYKAGIGSASINPEIRSAFVTLSELTSAQGARNTGLVQSALSGLDDLSTPEGILNNATRVTEMQAKLGDSMKHFSDLGIFHAGTQQELVRGESLFMVPSSILGKVQTLDSSGKKVGLLTQEGLNSPFSAVRLSVATRGDPDLNPTINAVLGGEALRGNGARARRAAFVEARSTYEATHELFAPYVGRPEAMVEAGLASSRDQALEHLSFFGAASRTRERTARVMELFEKTQKSGIVIASIEGEASGAGDIKRVLDTVADGIDSDTLAELKGLTYNLAGVTEQGVTLAPRVSQEALREAGRLSTGIATDLAKRTSGTSQLDLLKAGIRRGEESPEFFGKLEKATNAASEFGINRDLMNKMKKIKPKVYGTVAAVAALSAGYYLATRKSKQDPLDEVMEQQPLEQTGPMSIRDFNQVDKAMASQTSSRRDPLVTAGVVGNLDRNKIGHTQMGANKYNHLYGA